MAWAFECDRDSGEKRRDDKIRFRKGDLSGSHPTEKREKRERAEQRERLKKPLFFLREAVKNNGCAKKTGRLFLFYRNGR